MGWEIKGESGKPLNATLRSFEDLNIETWNLKLATLADDSFTWTAATNDASGSGTIIPAAGQVVELFLDGVRKFRGHVSFPSVGPKSVQVTVLGPWWWMDRIDLSSAVSDSTGATSDRTTYVFPTQSLQTSIRALIDRAIAMGVPITRGSVAASFIAPKISLANMSFAAALAELMRWLPDAVAYFDYTDALPELRVARRDSMSTFTFALGTTEIDEGAGFELRPRVDLEVKRVQLKYVQRAATTGKPFWKNQNFGTATTGKIQIVTVSGPEIVDFLPKDDFESYTIKTVVAAALPANEVSRRDSVLAGIRKTYGAVEGAPGAAINTWKGSATLKSLSVVRTAATTFRRPNGSFLTSSQVAARRLVTSTDIPEWARKLYGALDVTVSGEWLAVYYPPAGTSTKKWGPAFEALRVGGLTGGAFRNADTFGGNEKDYLYYVIRPFSFPATLINTAFVKATKVYKPWDYDYLAPPEDLAENLTAAQDWLPWEGRITVVTDELTGYAACQRKIRVTGGYAPWATMDALVKSVSYDGGRGRTTYELGAPARTDFGSLVNRVRREPRDNIVYL